MNPPRFSQEIFMWWCKFIRMQISHKSVIASFDLQMVSSLKLCFHSNGVLASRNDNLKRKIVIIKYCEFIYSGRLRLFSSVFSWFFCVVHNFCNWSFYVHTLASLSFWCFFHPLSRRLGSFEVSTDEVWLKKSLMIIVFDLEDETWWWCNEKI